MQDESRNTIIFLVCAFALFIAYQFFVMGPAEKRRAQEAAHAKAVAAATAATPPGAVTPGQPVQVPAAVTRAAALAATPRVSIDTPSLKGSVALRGARIDDLFLTNYR